MDIENRLVVARGEEEVIGMDGELRIGGYKQLHLEWIYDEVPLYNTGNYMLSLEIDHDRQ